MSSLTLLLVIILLVWLWRVGQDSRDAAVRTARDTCERQGLQFLDGTPSLRQIRPVFSRSSGPALRRTYTFDYSRDGFARMTGCIVMHNTRVSAVLLEAEHDVDDGARLL